MWKFSNSQLCSQTAAVADDQRQVPVARFELANLLASHVPCTDTGAGRWVDMCACLWRASGEQLARWSCLLERIGLVSRENLRRTLSFNVRRSPFPFVLVFELNGWGYIVAFGCNICACLSQLC